MCQKTLFFIFSLMCAFTATAQKLAVEGMEALPFDTYASVHKRLDLNQNPCAVVRVSLPVDGVTFSGTNLIGSIDRIGAEYIVFMPAGSKKMYIQHPKFHELEVVFGHYGIERLESLATYRVTVNVPQSGAPQQKMQTLTIKVTPADAIVQIDGDIVEQTVIVLSVGTHRYNVASKGYYTQEGTVEVNENIPAKLLVELDRKVTTEADGTQSPITSLQMQSAPQPLEEILPDGAEALFQKGKQAYDRHDFKEAVGYFSRAADKGHARAQFFYGECLYTGHGITRDFTQAMKWYRESADQGDASAQCKLGYCYEFGLGVTRNYPQARYWYQKSAEQGNEIAKQRLQNL